MTNWISSVIGTLRIDVNYTTLSLQLYSYYIEYNIIGEHEGETNESALTQQKEDDTD